MARVLAVETALLPSLLRLAQLIVHVPGKSVMVGKEACTPERLISGYQTPLGMSG